MTTTTLATQIEVDDQGRAWIAGTRTKVAEVVLDRLAYGWSIEEMHQQHPHLSLAELSAAMTYYYENQNRMDREIQDDEKTADALASRLMNLDLQERLWTAKQKQ